MNLPAVLKLQSINLTICVLMKAFFVFGLPVIIVAIIARHVLKQEPIAIDYTILAWLHAHITPTYNHTFLVITTFGNAAIIGLTTIVLVAWLTYTKRRSSAVIVFLSVSGAAAANLILKLLFHRHRPDFWPSLIPEVGYSFPSGHAMISCALLLSIIVITWSGRYRLPAVCASSVLIVLIGISRVYLGVHYPTDVIAGWCMGIIWTATVYIAVNKFWNTY